MQIKRVSLTNYRNYERTAVELGQGRNILVGDNAQGKTNFLESIEYVSNGTSWRASQDADLIKLGCSEMRIEVDYEVNGAPENIIVGMRRNTAPGGGGPGRGGKLLEKTFKLNGLSQSSIKAITHRLVTVSFKSHDLNLLRSGPKFRRDWIDATLIILRPQYKTVLASYQKVILQRNRLLKQLFEKGRVSVSDNDQLKVWDEQTARFGAQIVKERVALINKLLPAAELYQATISGYSGHASAQPTRVGNLANTGLTQRLPESLSCQYQFKCDESRSRGDSLYGEEEPTTANEEADANSAGGKVSSKDLDQAELPEVVSLLMRQLKALRFEEIRRKQTLAGPHRDDLLFFLNGADAVHFASQGQQRSLVLSLKLAELNSVTDFLNEPPVLLLDDVLAELDMGRQSLLMSLVAQNMQTIITTTHVTGFQPEWLDGARFLQVDRGNVQVSDQILC